MLAVWGWINVIQVCTMNISDLQLTGGLRNGLNMTISLQGH